MRDDEGTFDDEQLVREGGTFVRKEGGREVGCDEQFCAVDDMVDRPTSDDGIPGTVDDVPYDFGLELEGPADQRLDSIDRRFGYAVGETGEAEDLDTEPPLGSIDERDLWHRQRGLLAEEGEEVLEPERSDEEIERIAEASGEGAQEVNPESPEGKSSTGSV